MRAQTFPHVFCVARVVCSICCCVADASIIIDAFYCDCVTGFVPEGLEQTCHTNFDDCGSVPCQNEAECFDHVHSYTCVCAFGWDGENCDHSINPCSRSELRDCDDASRSLCEHVGPGMHTCTCRTGWECADPPPAGQCSGRICTDIDECASNPCQNDAACTESFVNTAVSLDSYRCSCIEGFTGGSFTMHLIE